jgi:hypothetical protein
MKTVCKLKYLPLLLLGGAVLIAILPLFKENGGSNNTYGEPDGQETKDEDVASFVD